MSSDGETLKFVWQCLGMREVRFGLTEHRSNKIYGFVLMRRLRSSLRFSLLPQADLTKGSPDVSNWYGVKIESTEGRVTELDWSSKQLSSRLPSMLGNLSALTKLYLHDNELRGTLAGLGKLTSLTHLSLHGNPTLSYTIPSDVAMKLTGLEYLTLQVRACQSEGGEQRRRVFVKSTGREITLCIRLPLADR